MKEIIIIGIEKIFKNGVYVMSKFWKIIVRVFRVGRVSILQTSNYILFHFVLRFEFNSFNNLYTFTLYYYFRFYQIYLIRYDSLSFYIYINCNENNNNIRIMRNMMKLIVIAFKSYYFVYNKIMNSWNGKMGLNNVLLMYSHLNRFAS